MLVSLDLETFANQPPRPKPVVGQAKLEDRPESESVILGVANLENPVLDDLFSLARDLLSSTFTLVFANAAFDMGVLYEWYPVLRPLIFKAYDDGRVFDVLIAQGLIDLEEGHLLRNKHGDPYRHPLATKNAEAYSLELVTWIQTGRANAKANADWRLRYGELYGKPINEYPPEAKQYLLDDAGNTLEVAQKQIASGAENLKDMARFVRRSFVLALGQGTALRTDPARVDEVERRTDEQLEQEQAFFRALGIIREDGTQDVAKTQREVARAYGCTTPCNECRGAGRTPSTKSKKKIKCRKCDGVACDRCLGTGLVDSKAKVPDVNCSTCKGAGVRVPPGLQTAAGGVVRDRDVMTQSDDPTLKRLGRLSWLKKIKQTYVPFLRECQTAPMSLRLGDLLENGRNSYRGLIQLIPREGGIRETFVAPDGFLYCSIDYSAAEACTLAQCAIWTVGYSEFAKALNAGLDPHLMLVSNMVHLPYAEVLARKKEFSLLRQGAKAGNYGFPGGMGFVKFTLAKRRENLYLCKLFDPNSPCGEVRVSSTTEFFQRLYPGLESNGDYHEQHFPPLCFKCLCATRDLKKVWQNVWHEIPKYLEHVEELNDRQHGKMRQFISGRIRGGCDARQAQNTLFSGLAADMASEALWNIAKECEDPRSPCYGVRMLFFSHDETFTLLPEDRAHEAAMRLTELQLAVGKKYCPDVKISAEPALMKSWSKKAEAKYNAHGRLVACDL